MFSTFGTGVDSRLKIPIKAVPTIFFPSSGFEAVTVVTLIQNILLMFTICVKHMYTVAYVTVQYFFLSNVGVLINIKVVEYETSSNLNYFLGLNLPDLQKLTFIITFIIISIMFLHDRSLALAFSNS